MGHVIRGEGAVQEGEGMGLFRMSCARGRPTDRRGDAVLNVSRKTNRLHELLYKTSYLYWDHAG